MQNDSLLRRGLMWEEMQMQSSEIQVERVAGDARSMWRCRITVAGGLHRALVAIASVSLALLGAVAAPGRAADAGPAVAQEFRVTSATKDQTHPQFGTGSKVGFAVDGVQGRTLVIVRGKTYRFNVDTGVQHDFYLTTDPAGWGAGTVTDGVSGNFTYKGVVTLTPTAATPDVIYYQCRNHKFMGGMIHVVNPGEEGKIQITAPAPAAATAAKDLPPLDRNEVKERLTFVDSFINKSDSAKRVAASNNDKAKAEQQEARDRLAAAMAAFAADKLLEAKTKGDEAMALMNAATRRVPSEAMLAAARSRYQELLRGLQTLIASYQSNYQVIVKEGGSNVQKLDNAKFDKAMATAKALHDEGNVSQANDTLAAAQSEVSDALNKMLANRTVSYKVEFASKAEEYEYELSRFAHYEELIPAALTQTQAPPTAVAQMRTYEQAARAKREQAVAEAKQQNFAAAIENVRSGIEQLDLALKILGVR